jgi:2-C-methyl-D-erythritol 4-phosphate cytidylyltransferase / 2-C-methyl-D-erythritol 2,4-cyclodiphosphate synthase
VVDGEASLIESGDPAEPGSRPRAFVIVVAAGSSTRMAGRDKLFADVAGRPLIAHTLGAIVAVPEVAGVVVVTAPERVAEVRAGAWLPAAVQDVVAGGARRHESVEKGLAALERASRAARDDIVLVHDGARPLVSAELIRSVIEAAVRHGAAIPVVPVAETLKRLDGDRLLGTVDRDGLGAAQTPQAFRVGLLRSAYNRFPPEGPETWTDEAALLEACTIPVHAVPGDPANFKVTLPGDLERVRATLLTRDGGTASAGPSCRIGFGQDTHPFGPDQPLVLGGVEVIGAPRLAGHSDGDVVLHAVADALLGAAGLGDLGRLFPAGPETPAGVDSADLLREVLGRVTARDLLVVGVDVTVIGGRPRLADMLPTIATRIGGLLGIGADRVSIKASTGNLAGFEGAGRGISAIALAHLEASGSPSRQ